MSIESCIHLPIHEHWLVLQEFSKTCRLKCRICDLPIGTCLTYQCLECEDVFVMHKSCAERDPWIQHPFHPDHPLYLSGKIGKHRCAGCRYNVCSIGYQCEVCRVYMDLNCAAATLPPIEGDHGPKPEEEVIQYLAHEHPLTSFLVDVSNDIKCKGCNEEIKGQVYGCRGCFYILHESCALLPTKMLKHPFHPHHSLVLQAYSKKNGYPNDLLMYLCEECDFSIDFRCVVSVLRHPGDNENDEEPVKPSRHHFSHPHQLTSLHATKELSIKCKLCTENISGNFWCCPDCLFMVHEFCAELSEEIMHPFHPDHPLIYQSVSNYDEPSCEFCHNTCRLEFYFCADCEFSMHVSCVVQSLHVSPTIQHVHEHQMRLYRNFYSECKVCGRFIKGPCYACPEMLCSYTIHIECADLPLSVLEHHFHPKHPLVLCEKPTRESGLCEKPTRKSGPCNACLEYCNGMFYSCESCKFRLHLSCALPGQTIKHPRHQHVLTYFEKTGKLVCNLCYGDCSFDLYRCVPCDYNLHCGCMLLPKSLKHKLHIHPMELRDRVVVEHLALDDQYCDLCETPRNPEHGVYYCDQCCCAAHIDCVIPKDERQKLGDKIVLQKIDEEIANADEQAKEMKAELEKLEENLEASTKEQERIENKRQETLSLLMQLQAGEVELDIERGMNSSNRLQLPIHEHGLVFFREISKHIDFNCDICSLPLKEKPYYLCPDCEGTFVIHKSCAEAAPLIQHPYHLDHPLVFRKVNRDKYLEPPLIIKEDGLDKECCGCKSVFEHSGYAYGCEICNVRLHVPCATASLPSHDQQEEKLIQHIAHEHPLALFDVNVGNHIECKACHREISGLVYGCRGCFFMLHESCAFLPTEVLKHPFHPQHLLYLQTGFLQCHACRSNDKLFAYQCHECHFNLDVDCVSYVMHNELWAQTRHHFTHPHQLISLHATSELRIECKLCRKNISGSFYCCPDCLFMLHEPCLESSQEIVHHPLHPDHPLIYQSKPDESITMTDCKICKDFKHIPRSDPIFHCSDCSFSAHVVCTFRTLSATGSGTLQYFPSHPHPMYIVDQKLSPCVVCWQPIGGIGYYCVDCSIGFHTECTDIPSELQHSFHRQHPLILHPQPLKESAPCDVCLRPLNEFCFACDSCKFQVHAGCALKRPSLKHPRHEHDLTYFDKIEQHLLCNVCYEDCCIDLYRCVPCNYNLHYFCKDLPPSVEHELHIHPMVLRDRFVVEHLRLDDQYCDLCETLRHPDHGVYYCDQCYCAAHIDCVIPKDERQKLRDALMCCKSDEEEIAIANKKTEELKAKTEELKKELEASRKEIERLNHHKWETMSSRMQGEA